MLGSLIFCNSQKSWALTDTIAGQLRTVEKLKKLMADENYDEAILLFSKRQQTKITKNRRKKPESYIRWCMAWTLDGAKYNRYVRRIKAKGGIFVFEDNEWKIDEN